MSDTLSAVVEIGYIILAGLTVFAIIIIGLYVAHFINYVEALFMLHARKS